MAIESQAASVRSGRLDSPIENEIPQYRAVSRWAVASAISGALTALTFANFNFLVAGALAILCGALALRKIGKFPDVFTGKGLANVGIALGLIFSLSPVTMHFASEALLRREAEGFARQYIQVLQTRDLGNAIWHRLPPAERKGMAPAEALAKYEAATAEKGPNPGSTAFVQPIKMAHELLGLPGQSLRFVQVEKCGSFELTPFALLLLKLDIAQSTLDEYVRAHPEWKGEKAAAKDEHDHDHGEAEDHDHGDGHDHAKESAQTTPDPKAAAEAEKTPSIPRNRAIELVLNAPEGTRDNLYMLLDVRATVENGKKKWWVSNIIFPYKLKTYQAETLKKGEQHGDHTH